MALAQDREALTPAEVMAAGTDALVVDIRPREERFGDLGYIPGSLCLPLSGSPEDDTGRLREQLTHHSLAVLACTTGRRSAVALQAMGDVFPRPISHLEGGLLGWRAGGYPTCSVLETKLEGCPEATDPEALQRALRACFIGEMVERSFSAEYDAKQPEVDPMALLRECYEAEGVDWDAPSAEGLLRVVDRMGVVSRRMGSDLETIAKNTDRMMAALAQVS